MTMRKKLNFYTEILKGGEETLEVNGEQWEYRFKNLQDAKVLFVFGFKN